MRFLARLLSWKGATLEREEQQLDKMLMSGQVQASFPPLNSLLTNP
jgi:hypothetical protein